MEMKAVTVEDKVPEGNPAISSVVTKSPQIATTSIIENRSNSNNQTSSIFVQDICLLKGKGVSVKDVDKLRGIGINTIKGLKMTPRKRLLKLKSFDDKKVQALQDAASKLMANNNTFCTALDVCDLRSSIFRISTGSKNFDLLLDGGIQSMSVTEVFGEFKTGKTQLAHTLCVTAQITNDDLNYVEGKVMFIDTENTFRPERIKQIAKRFCLNTNETLENILYARAYTIDHLFEILKKAAKEFHEGDGVFKLLIIDSIMALFRVEFCGRGELVERQQRLGQMLGCLQKISEEYNIVVFVTNQVTSSPSPLLLSEMDFSNTSKPTGGNIMAHATTTRISMKKAIGNSRVAGIYDSPELEEKEAVFVITRGGIDDPVIPKQEPND